MKRIRWGIVGTGAMAELFCQALLSLQQAQIQAVSARTQERANSFAAQFGAPTALADYDQLLQETAVDVVYISTPNEFHYEHCLKAIKAGKAVLCEKPFAVTLAQATEVISLARARGVFCMEAMWMRFAPAVRDALLLAQEGKLGSLEYFSGQLGFPYLADPQNRLFRQPGGGALLDLGVYPLSLAHAFMGSPVRISSTAELGSAAVDEQFAAVLGYKSGAQAVVAASLRVKLANSASIHGRSAVLTLEEPLYFPERYQVIQTPTHSTKQRSPGRFSALRRSPAFRNVLDVLRKTRIHSVNRRTSQSGYAMEAAEVHRCLQAGLAESPAMPWSDTLAVLDTMDSIRSHWVSGLS